MRPHALAVSRQKNFAILQDYFVNTLVIDVVFNDENSRSVIALPILCICHQESPTTTFRHSTELSTCEMSLLMIRRTMAGVDAALESALTLARDRRTNHARADPADQPRRILEDSSGHEAAPLSIDRIRSKRLSCW
jgi:hypothetical protein